MKRTRDTNQRIRDFIESGEDNPVIVLELLAELADRVVELETTITALQHAAYPQAR